MTDFGERIARFRKELNLSAQDLSDCLGGAPSRSAIANWETGRRKDINVGELVAVAAVLSVEPADICPELEFGREAKIQNAKRILRRATREVLSELEEAN